MVTLKNEDDNYQTFDESKSNSCLYFQNIKVTINSKQNERVILDDVSGKAFPSQIYGIIGTSGGGKTTLELILSGRISTISSSSKYNICGNIKFNDKSIFCSNMQHMKYLQQSTAFVSQENLLISTELAREAIELSALLRLPKTMTKQQKICKAQNILSALDLIECSETKIGGEKVRGLSGGERKRVSIGIQLVTDSDILILDEPTSGLDSATAGQIMLLLKKLSKSGKMVITSIHQPSTKIWNMFDRVLILSNGRVMYEGDVSLLPQYLFDIGYDCPKHSNISDFALQKISLNYELFAGKWNNKNAFDITFDNNNTYVSLVNDEKQEMVLIFQQLSILIKRHFAIFRRDKIATIVRFMQTIFVAVLQGILWWQIESINEISYYNEIDYELQENSQMIGNLNNRFGAIFFASTFAAMNALMTTNLVFPAQKLVFEKERNDNWYYTTIWIISKSLIDFPVTALALLPFSIILKYMVNFNAEFYQIYFILTLIALVADSMGFLLGCVSNRPEVAMQLTPVTIMPLFLFSNFFISNETIPQWINWIQWIDCFYYGTEALAIYEFEGVQSNDQPPIGVGNEFLESLNMNASNQMRDVYCLLALFVGFRVIAILYLIIKNGL